MAKSISDACPKIEHFSANYVSNNKIVRCLETRPAYILSQSPKVDVA